MSSNTILFVSFNVNSLRVRMHQIRAVVEKYSPTVIGIQETKVVDDDFPIKELEELGYYSYYSGQPTHYGVALLSKIPLENVVTDLEGSHQREQRRFIAGDLILQAENRDHRIHVINTYFPQGESRKHPTKYDNKLAFYDAVTAYITAVKSQSAVALLGDLNVAPEDRDVQLSESGRKRWIKQEACSFLPEEREKFNALLSLGLSDPYLTVNQDDTHRASWFDYRNRGFTRDPKSGLRIDFVLLSEGLDKCATSANIDYDIRAMEKPSDHCPVVTAIDLDKISLL